MSYGLTTIDDGHIILMTLNADFDIVTEFKPLFQACFQLMEDGPDGIVVISDAREVHFKSLDELLQGSSMVRGEDSVRVNKHRKLRKAYTVTNSTGISLAAKGLNSATFGFVELSVFGSLEEAIESARGVIRGKD